VVAGIAATPRTDTRGLHRNAVAALVATSLPRLAASPGGVVDWRKSPFPDQSSGTERGAGGSKAFQSVAAGRNVVLVILESTAARHLGAYGAKWDPMPNLTGLASQAIVFERAYAVYPESIKGLFATLCSQYPAFDTAPELYAAAPCGSLPQRLKEAGYRTALFHSGRFGYLGMRSIIDDRGFDVLEDAGAIGGVVNSSFGVDDRSTAERVLRWVDGLDPGRRFFVTYEPIGGHHPYATAVPGPLEGHDDLTRYLNALRESDEALGRLLRGLRERHLDEQTVFVVFGDHGEAFGEHPGNFAHTLFIYEENVHVPLVVAAPGAIREEVRVSRPASIIDIAPTILDLLGMPADPGHQGSSLLEPQPRMSLFFTDYSIGWLGLVDGCWKYLYEMDGRRSRLFDVCLDPMETRDRSPEFPERVSAYRERVQQWAAAQKERISRGLKTPAPQP
jgi:arylsulfatase A-like enzyme